MNLPDDLKHYRADRKPLRLQPVAAPSRETPLQAARRRYGKPFGVLAWATGEGPRYWTAERVARLAAQNEEHRMRRRNAAEQLKRSS